MIINIKRYLEFKILFDILKVNAAFMANTRTEYAVQQVTIRNVR